MTSLTDFQDDTHASGAERRSHPRRRDNSPVYVGDGGVARKCALVDVSAGGARIFVGKGVDLPDYVVLVDPRTGLSRRAKLVWRTATEVGVRFLEQGVRYRVLSRADLSCDGRRWAS